MTIIYKIDEIPAKCKEKIVKSTLAPEWAIFFYAKFKEGPLLSVSSLQISRQYVLSLTECI